MQNTVESALLSAKHNLNSFMDLYEIQQAWKNGRLTVTDAKAFANLCELYPNRPVVYSVFDLAKTGGVAYVPTNEEMQAQLAQMNWFQRLLYRWVK